ncbi:hypothetical protein GW17_00053104 [Ensete ventricosum]|nr:hypothetical protein GW17_00053104 [Ensete ventricosum]
MLDALHTRRRIRIKENHGKLKSKEATATEDGGKDGGSGMVGRHKPPLRNRHVSRGPFILSAAGGRIRKVGGATWPVDLIIFMGRVRCLATRSKISTCSRVEEVASCPVDVEPRSAVVGEGSTRNPVRAGDARLTGERRTLVAPAYKADTHTVDPNRYPGSAISARQPTSHPSRPCFHRPVEPRGGRRRLLLAYPARSCPSAAPSSSSDSL